MPSPRAPFTFSEAPTMPTGTDVTPQTPIDVIREKLKGAVALFDSLFGQQRKRLNTAAFLAQDIERRFKDYPEIYGEVWKRVLSLRHRWNEIRNRDAEDKNKAVAHIEGKGGTVTTEQYRELVDGLDPETGKLSEKDGNANPFLNLGVAPVAAAAGGAVAIIRLVTIAIGLVTATFAIYWLGRIVTNWQETRQLQIENEALITLLQRLLEAGVTPDRAAEILGISLKKRGTTNQTPPWTWIAVGGGALVVALLALRRPARA